MNNSAKFEKIAEIPLKELQELIDNIKKCRRDKEKLISAINFLNEEIRKYNSEYADKINEELKDILDQK